MQDTHRETYNLEFKEKLSSTFLKTVSAFANYEGGRIQFGVTDEGENVGLKNLREVCSAIENKISDTISPTPRYSIEVDEDNGIINLLIHAGKDKPYFYRSKAYRKGDSATIEVDRPELIRLILEGEHKTFDSMPSKEQCLSFDYLENKFVDILGISGINNDILLSLELRDKDNGFTNAGEMFADANSFKGIDIVKFGPNINTILHRYTFEHISILEAFDKTIGIYEENYQYEVIEGAYREKREKIPEEAFREAVANALVHRDWLVESRIQISMKENSIEIVSPGRLPEGLSKEDYLDGQISVMRNPIIGNIFFRLDIIESFGTGIRRIKEAYSASHKKPNFKIFENSIQIELPVISRIDALTADVQEVYKAVENKKLASSEIAESTGFGKNKVLNLLNELIEGNYVAKSGTGRGTKYTVK